MPELTAQPLDGFLVAGDWPGRRGAWSLSVVMNFNEAPGCCAIRGLRMSGWAPDGRPGHRGEKCAHQGEGGGAGGYSVGRSPAFGSAAAQIPLTPGSCTVSQRDTEQGPPCSPPPTTITQVADHAPFPSESKHLWEGASWLQPQSCSVELCWPETWGRAVGEQGSRRQCSHVGDLKTGMQGRGAGGSFPLHPHKWGKRGVGRGCQFAAAKCLWV